MPSTLRLTAYAMATACLIGLFALASALMLALKALGDDDFFSGIVIIFYDDIHEDCTSLCT